MKTKPASSSSSTNLKPVNVFYVWYTELCRRNNQNPSPMVKPAKPKCQTVLDFICDRLKVEEWASVNEALRLDTSLHVISIRSRIGHCQFLHEVDTEAKAKTMKRKYGVLWTSYISKSLFKSLSNCLRHTQVLTRLELDGLPIFSQYLEQFLQALKKNKTIKYLSFVNSSIKDIGCQMVCSEIRFTPNIEIINFSSCDLTTQSAEYIANLIKYQQINRYCESWHNSLRYEDPESEAMRGIKRISLNCNPLIGDEGMELILKELEDDLWIKALDMQKCGLTEKIAQRIVDIIEYNRSLDIVDVRQNELIENRSFTLILEALRKKQPSDYVSEYQWCSTAVELAWSYCDSSSTMSNLTTSQPHKSKSVPAQKVVEQNTGWEKLRKAKTEHVIAKSTSRQKVLSKLEGQEHLDLNSQCSGEPNSTTRRTDTSRKIRESGHVKESKSSFKTIVSSLDSGKSKLKMSAKVKAEQSETKKNGFKNGIKNFEASASTVFEKLLKKETETDVAQKTCLDDSCLEQLKEDVNHDLDAERSNSEISLCKFIAELKSKTKSRYSLCVDTWPESQRSKKTE